MKKKLIVIIVFLLNNSLLWGKDIKENLVNTVKYLAHEIGERSYKNTNALKRAEGFIASKLKEYGYKPEYQTYTLDGLFYHKNIFVEILGNKFPNDIFVIGAHYDTVIGTPGADDNASGVAVLLEIARLIRNKKFDYTIHLVAFTLEEPPFFMTEDMGSYRYAKDLKNKGINVLGMISLEMVGFFTDRKKSQSYPLPFMNLFYPKEGNFIAIVSNRESKDFLDMVEEGFKRGTTLPVETLSAPSFVLGINFSDHWSFNQFGFKSVMITDTAFYRNKNYHKKTDTYDTLDYDRMVEVVKGTLSALEFFAKNNKK
ncbi:MAG: M28 family peptidase [Proteobacteria bacterium]|nr:M28 family peptidase [Pseudomonadota bacterium]